MTCREPVSRGLVTQLVETCAHIGTAAPGYASGSCRGPTWSLLGDLAVFHHELHVFQNLYVPKRVAAHGDDVGIRSGRNHADLSLHVEHLGGSRSCALDRVHG